jgi:hypothetical protein
MKPLSTLSILMICLIGLSLTGCGGLKPEAKYPTGLDRAITGGDNIYGKPESVLGDGGLLGDQSKSDNGKGENGVQVNSYLWRAALDTISFMPLASADPFGGTIITDWYADPKMKGERTKLNVFILGRELKASNLRVKAFRQTAAGGAWKEATVSATTERALEDAILTRARQIRVAKEEGGLF